MFGFNMSPSPNTREHFVISWHQLRRGYPLSSLVNRFFSLPKMWPWHTFFLYSVLRLSLCPPFLALSAWVSQCVTLCSFCVSVWKLGTPNYRGLSIIMCLAAEMYWRTVPPWKKRTPNINWGILLLRSIAMFLTVISIPSDLSKYLCLAEKKRKEKRDQYENYAINSDILYYN